MTPDTVTSDGVRSGVTDHPIRLIAVLGALSMFGPLSLDMYLPALPSLTYDFSTTASRVQLTLTACMFGLALGQLFTGPLSDVFGRRIPLMIGLLTYAVSSVLCAVAPTVEILIAVRLIQGAAGAAGIVISRAVVRDLYEGSELARIFSFVMVVNGLAPILAPVIGGQLLLITPWPGIFMVLGLIGIALLLAVVFTLPESLPSDRRQTGGLPTMLRTFRMLMTDRLFVGYVLSAGLAFGAMFAYIAGSPFVLQNIYDVSPQMFSLIFGTNAFGIVVASQINARVVDRLGSRFMLRLGLFGSATGGISLALSVAVNAGLYGILATLFVVVSSIGFILPNTVALAMADHPDVAGSASALIGVMQFIIGAVVAPLAGVGGEHTAVPMAASIAVLGLSALITSIVLTGWRHTGNSWSS